MRRVLAMMLMLAVPATATSVRINAKSQREAELTVLYPIADSVYGIISAGYLSRSEQADWVQGGAPWSPSYRRTSLAWDGPSVGAGVGWHRRWLRVEGGVRYHWLQGSRVDEYRIGSTVYREVSGFRDTATTADIAGYVDMPLGRSVSAVIGGGYRFALSGGTDGYGLDGPFVSVGMMVAW